MGLLDDAIREHLELKRRRGADPSEIAREETEALGPVRREAREDEEEPAAYDDEPFDDVEDDRDRPHLGDPPTTHDHVWAEAESESATPPHGDPLAHQPTREFSSLELDEALGQHEAPAAAEPPAPRTPEPAAREDEGDDGEDDAAADELDQTPDFLQETPEHDRLWFEQKPPKDFDF